MKYGYARISTDGQSVAAQVEALIAAGAAKVFREAASGAQTDRAQPRKALAQLAAGDVVVIPAVDRLSRDTTDLLVTARDMQRAGAGLRSLAELVVDATSDFAELVLAMLGLPPSSNAAASSSARRAAEPTPRPMA